MPQKEIRRVTKSTQQIGNQTTIDRIVAIESSEDKENIE